VLVPTDKIQAGVDGKAQITPASSWSSCRLSRIRLLDIPRAQSPNNHPTLLSPTPIPLADSIQDPQHYFGPPCGLLLLADLFRGNYLFKCSQS